VDNLIFAYVFLVTSLKVAFNCGTVTSLLAEAQTINYLHFIYSKEKGSVSFPVECNSLCHLAALLASRMQLASHLLV